MQVDIGLNNALGGKAESDDLIAIEHVSGSNHADGVWGAAGANVIHGWAGDDWLVGRGGDDALHGGEGADDNVQSLSHFACEGGSFQTG